MQGHKNKSESEDSGEQGMLCVVDLKMMLCMFTVENIQTERHEPKG